jgi:hypothetical protein
MLGPSSLVEVAGAILFEMVGRCLREGLANPAVLDGQALLARQNHTCDQLGSCLDALGESTQLTIARPLSDSTHSSRLSPDRVPTLMATSLAPWPPVEANLSL